MRGWLQSLRRPIHPAPAPGRAAFDQLPGLQQTGSARLVYFQLPKIRLDFRRQKSRLHRPQTSRQRRIRKTVTWIRAQHAMKSLGLLMVLASGLVVLVGWAAARQGGVSLTIIFASGQRSQPFIMQAESANILCESGHVKLVL